MSRGDREFEINLDYRDSVSKKKGVEGREGREAEGKQKEDNREERGAKNLKINNDHRFHVRSNLVFLKMSL